MNTNQQSTTQPEISHVSYGELGSKIDAANMPEYDQNKAAYDRITQNFLIKPTQPALANPSVVGSQTNTNAQVIQTFVANTLPIPSVDIFSVLKKAIMAFIITLPVSLLLVAFAFFLIENQFNPSRIALFPLWTTDKVEAFVKDTIIPQLPHQ